jgi:hypothetical protein
MVLLRIIETESIKQYTQMLVEMEGSNFVCLFKAVAGSPAIGSIAAVSADA